MKCRICEINQSSQTFKVREMMFGTQETFLYFECPSCGCLQLYEVPEDMSKYYPQNYYLSDQPKSKKVACKDKILSTFSVIIHRAIRTQGLNIFPSYFYEYIRNTNVNSNSRVLEVGCGKGNLLRNLQGHGFNNVLGIDPYIDKEFIGDDTKIVTSSIHELSDDREFDLIIFDHSFEHVPDQMKMLAKVSRILSDDGICLIRIPVKTKYIWNQYGVNWVQIDAPRHFYLHSLNSFELLVKRSRLSIQDVIFDSTEFQFLGSEQYKRNIPLRAWNSYYVNPKESLFTKSQIQEFKKMAAKLNSQRQGDQAAFFLTKAV